MLNRSDARYIRCDHVVAGFEFTSPSLVRITLEGFYKNYSQYPFNLRDSISIANQGSDFGTVGTAPVRFDNRGRSYGIEFMVQQKLFKKVFGLLAYTFLRSEFEGLDGTYLPSSWDFRHVVSLTGGKYFPKNWQVGFRLRFNSGTPYLGGLVGWPAPHAKTKPTFEDPKSAVVHGSVVASYTCEGFSTHKLQTVTPLDVAQRIAELKLYTQFA